MRSFPRIVSVHLKPIHGLLRRQHRRQTPPSPPRRVICTSALTATRACHNERQNALTPQRDIPVLQRRLPNRLPRPNDALWNSQRCRLSVQAMKPPRVGAPIAMAHKPSQKRTQAAGWHICFTHLDRTVLMTRLRPSSTLRQFTNFQSELPEGATIEIGRTRHLGDSAGRLV